jgi:hypothetical protein
MSSYDYKDEYGTDPFEAYTKDETLKAKLVAAIPEAIDYAIHRPEDPRQANTRLLQLCKELSNECNQDMANPLAPYIMDRFWRVCALPDPIRLEEQRIQLIERERKEEFLRNNPPTCEQLAKRTAANIATHSGGWTYHDHECQCGRYFDDFPCPRGGSIWTCCGSTMHDSVCSRERK